MRLKTNLKLWEGHMIAQKCRMLGYQEICFLEVYRRRDNMEAEREQPQQQARPEDVA